MSLDIQMDADGIDLKGVPVNFRGGLATGAAIVAALLFGAGVSEEDVTYFLLEYREKVDEVMAQVEPQIAAQMALRDAKVEGAA